MLSVRTLALLASVLFIATAQGQLPANNADEKAIRELVQHYLEARNSRDADATRALLTPDADQLVSTGEWRKGIDAFVRGAMASSQRENAKSSITIESVRLLDPDVAIADGRYETSSADSGAVRHMWTTLIVKRTASGWRIAAIRNMLPALSGSNGHP